MPSVAILGASARRHKFGNKALRAFRDHQFLVFPIHPHAPQIEGIPCYASIEDLPQRPDWITVYLPPNLLSPLLPAIAKSGCDQLWLNPGTESPEVLHEINRLNLPAKSGCSIRAIGADPSDYNP